MTEAGWTNQRPNREGVYWFRWSVSSRPLIVSVAKDDCAWRVLEMGNQYDGSLAGYSDGEWLGPITPDSYQQGRVAVNVDALVDRFLAWPLPASVCSDLCATKQGYPHRSGTNLLSAVEAKAMIEHVLGIAQQAQEGGVGDVHG